jgi:ATP-dependent exoDNAse (exonuclease V) alpha subunit
MLLQNVNDSAGWVNGRIALITELNDDNIVIQAADDPNLTLPITPIERAIPYTAYSRRQFPITLAWAFTIHKVQSLTLSTVAVDINNLFAQGHLYVALSRVRKLSDLYIINWTPDKPIRKFQYNKATINLLQSFTAATT